MARFTQWRNVATLLRFDEADGSTEWVDERQFPVRWTADGNTASQSAVLSPYGGSCVYLDGAGDRISRADTSYVLGEGDFTVEGWVHPLWLLTSPDGRIFQSGITATLGGLWITRDGSTDGIKALTYDGSAYRTVGAGAASDAEWVYVTLCRRDSIYYFFLDGTLLTTTDESGQPGNNLAYNTYMFGATETVSQGFGGYLSDWRVTKEAALYTESFTAPTAPLDGDGYVRDTSLVNRDFEDAGEWVGGLPTGWTRVSGTSEKRTTDVSDDGGTTAFYQPSGTETNVVSQTVTIPIGAQKLRWNGRLKGTGSDWDESYAAVALRDASGVVVGGAVAATNTNVNGVYEDLYQEAWVPDTAVTADIVVGNVRQDGTQNNSTVLGVELWWLEDATYTPYFTENKVVNGGFETGDLTGWTDSSAYDDIAVVVGISPPIAAKPSGNIVRRSPPNVLNSLIGSISQTDLSIPVGATSFTVSCTARSTITHENDRLRLSAVVRDSGGIELLREQAWSTSWCEDYFFGNSLDVYTLPAGAATVDVAIDWWQGDDSDDVCQSYADDVSLVFYNELTPIDTSEQLYLRKENNTWFHVNPVFGPGRKGMAPDPVTVSQQRYLRDDGVWAIPAGGDGVIAGDSNIDGGTPTTIYTVLDIDGGAP